MRRHRRLEGAMLALAGGLLAAGGAAGQQADAPPVFAQIVSVPLTRARDLRLFTQFQLPACLDDVSAYGE